MIHLRSIRSILIFREIINNGGLRTALRRIFGSKSDEAVGVWRKLHTTELCSLFHELNIIRVIKSRSMKWAGNVARMREMKKPTKF
jgi:hypothetical protein